MPPGDLDGGATLYLSQANDEFPRGRRAMIFAENARNAVVLEDAADGAIAGARGTAGCRRLVHVQGESRPIAIRDSRVPEGATAVTDANERLRRGVKVW